MGSQTEDCNEFLYVKYPEVEMGLLWLAYIGDLVESEFVMNSDSTLERTEAHKRLSSLNKGPGQGHTWY
jgi:hypothetical protein